MSSEEHNQIKDIENLRTRQDAFEKNQEKISEKITDSERYANKKFGMVNDKLDVIISGIAQQPLLILKCEKDLTDKAHQIFETSKHAREKYRELNYKMRWTVGIVSVVAFAATQLFMKLIGKA